MSPRILITGASGFLGQAVVREARKKGLAVIGMGRSDAPRVFDGEWVQQNPFSQTQSLPEVDVCIHLAWPTAAGYANSPENMEMCTASLRMIEHLHRKGCTHVVVAGSCAEYASGQSAPIGEEGLLADETVYGRAKNQLHKDVNRYMDAHSDMTMSWARIFQVYGPGEREQRLLPHLARLWQNQTEFQAASCTQLRDYLHVDDVAAALVLLSMHRAKGVYNLCSGQPVRLRELIGLFGKHFPCGPLVRFGAKQDREGWEPPVMYGCNRKLRELGWRQTVSLQEGLATYARLLQPHPE